METVTIKDKYGDPVEVTFEEGGIWLFINEKGRDQSATAAFTRKQAKKLRKALKRALAE